MHRYLNFAVFAVLIFFLAACASSGPSKTVKPDWVSGESSKYPLEFYLIGVGEGRSAPHANNVARGELSKSVKVSIKADMTSRLDVEQNKRGGKSSETVSQRTQQLIRSSSNVELDALKISESWFDEKAGLYYALATLDRQQAASAFRKDISELDERIIGFVENSKQAREPFDRVRAVVKAQNLFAKRVALNEYLRAVDKGGKGRSSMLSQAELESHMMSVLKQVTIEAKGDGQYGAELADAAMGSLSSNGYGTSSDAANFILNITLRFDEPRLDDGWYWVRGTMDVALIDKVDNATKGQHSWSIKKSATDAPAAVGRVLEDAKSKLTSDLGMVLLGLAGE